MRSSTSVLLLVLVGSVLVAGQHQGCPVSAFWRNIARMRVQAILTMFPDIAEEIRNGQLTPNNRNNGNQQLPINNGQNGQLNGNQQLPINNGQNGQLNGNQQGNNRLPFDPLNLNRNSNLNQGANPLDNLNNQLQQNNGNNPLANPLNGALNGGQETSTPANGLLNNFLNGQQGGNLPLRNAAA